MGEVDWPRIEWLFHQARELPPGDRTALLDDACADDAGVRRRVEGLLAAHETLKHDDAAFLGPLDPLRVGALLGAAGPSRPPPDRDRLGRYPVDRVLGRGGMGVVYLARDPELDRPVALKLLADDRGDPAGDRRLVAEARAASALDHPNIGTVYEVGETEEGRYIAMAYYDGETLRQRLGRGPLDPAVAADIAAQVADGLAAAHAVGIIHRDIKPENLILTRDGVVKIVDFGVAKVAARTDTRPGTVGTVAYMSPEQTRGEAVDGRTDMWSLGVVLYELLTGSCPFAGRMEAIIYGIRNDAPAPVRTVRPEIPPELAAVVDRCLEKDPAARFESADTLAAALRDSSARPARGYGDGSTPRAPRWKNRSPAWLAVAALAVLLVGFGIWSMIPASGTRDVAAADRSIAVLPFENLTGSEAEPYVRGIHDDLLTRLSGVAGLRVISRRAVDRYRDGEGPTAAIAADLGVRWVLEGGVAKLQDQLQVNVRLVDPLTESHVWSRSYRRDLTARDLFGLQSEITMEIARSLRARITPEEMARVERTPTDDLGAYRRYVEGRTHLDGRTEAGLRQGANRFRQAIALDSTYALAWAGLADALTLLAAYGHLPRDSVMPEAPDAADRAVRLDPDLAEGRASLGLTHMSLRNDGPAALRELRRAVELKPSYARGNQWLGTLLMALGRLEEAGRPLKYAARLEPTSAPAHIALARWYLYSDSLEAALEQARIAERLSPSYPSALLFAGEALRGMGRLEEARDALTRALELPGVNITGYPGVWIELAVVHDALGDTLRSRQLVQRLEEQAPPTVLAAVYAGLRRREAALDLLLSSGMVIAELAEVLRYQPIFDPVRDDPRFHRIIREFNLAWGLTPDGHLPLESASREAPRDERSPNPTR